MLKWKIEALLVRSRNLNLKELDASDFHSLIFIPHADDELVGCYSLIKDAGSVSGVYFAFLGDDYSEENKEKRSTELKKFALSRNLQLFGVPSNNEELINIINKKKINSIFLPCLIDWHPEHIKVSDYLYHFLKETRSLEIILNCSIYMYQVSVPLPDLLFNSYIGLSNCEQRKKWSEFCEFYSSQKHLPTYRFGIQECVSARNTEYYSVESFVEMTISEWLLFYETFKEKYIESDFTAMKSNISNIREIRKMSNNLYMKIYGKRY